MLTLGFIGGFVAFLYLVDYEDRYVGPTGMAYSIEMLGWHGVAMMTVANLIAPALSLCGIIAIVVSLRRWVRER